MTNLSNEQDSSPRKFNPKLVILRPSVPADLKFIQNNWVEACVKADSYKAMAFQLWKPNFLKYVENVVGNSVTVIAEDDRGLPIGFIVFRQEQGLYIISCLFVRPRFRRKGVGQILLNVAINPKGATMCTHTFSPWRKFMKRNKMFYYPMLDFKHFEEFVI